MHPLTGLAAPIFDTDFDQEINYKYRHVSVTAQNLITESTESFDKNAGKHKWVSFDEISEKIGGDKLNVELVLSEDKEVVVTIDTFIQALFAPHEDEPYFDNKKDHDTWEKIYRNAVCEILDSRITNL
jgi:hypothetical protein